MPFVVDDCAVLDIDPDDFFDYQDGLDIDDPYYDALYDYEADRMIYD